MFSKANIVSTLITSIWGLAGGFLLWGLLAEPYLTPHILISDIMRDPPDMIHLILGCLIQGFAFSTLYSRWANGNFGLGSGLSFGIWITLLLGLGAGLIDYATSTIVDIQGTLINFIIYLIFFGITGLLAGIIFKKLG
ncbi:hypothetical protein [Ulvibacter antarcticus]|uniref:Uncharacterized protein n=1 Tax=Ulvibacter antarcticus TaxID=442714 RepID=A0A3L9Z1M1_9FLAO|nr:hypothetical protein [Ulvibacter antarcticus]RMA66424.1 hypothetical protein BXY75_0849 [Ulvibacter antarcticus]